jgi:hypothetical protein
MQEREGTKEGQGMGMGIVAVVVLPLLKMVYAGVVAATNASVVARISPLT